jgi:16S rRNA U516 pseudouridylate synthase RsuA-like enzyme
LLAARADGWLLDKIQGILVIDKPSGLVCQGGKDLMSIDANPDVRPFFYLCQSWNHFLTLPLPMVRRLKKPTLDQHLAELSRRLNLPPNSQILTVHRLDKQTTGPLILALNPQKAKDLSNQFKNRKIEKSTPDGSFSPFSFLALL